MLRRLKTAICAVASPLLRLETAAAMAVAGLELLAEAGDAGEALRLTERLRPDLLIVDEELPVMPGALLAGRVSCEKLPVRPAVILLHWPEFLLPQREKLEARGVRILEKPLRGDALRRAADLLEASPPHFPEGETALAGKLMDALGVPEHPGRRCLESAALLCAGDERCLHAMNERLFPVVGKLQGMSAAQVERAMRHAIDLAWQSDQFENQYRIFADTVDAGRGRPTCGQMISRLSDILRLEG